MSTMVELAPGLRIGIRRQRHGQSVPGAAMRRNLFHPLEELYARRPTLSGSHRLSRVVHVFESHGSSGTPFWNDGALQAPWMVPPGCAVVAGDVQHEGVLTGSELVDSIEDSSDLGVSVRHERSEDLHEPRRWFVLSG